MRNHHWTHALTNLSNFKAIDELKFYMDLYWHYSFIPEYNDDLSPSTFSGEWIGHPAGHLTLIGYCHLQPAVSAVLNSYDDPVYGVSIESEPRDRLMPILNDQKNWSTTNLDQPYSKCSICECVIDPQCTNSNLCHKCHFHRSLFSPE